MNTLDVAIRAVLVPFRSLSRCLAENYKMYFGYSTVFSVQYLSGGVKMNLSHTQMLYSDIF